MRLAPPIRGGLSGEPWHQRPPIAGMRYRPLRPFQDGWHYVDGLGEGIHLSPTHRGGRVGITDDQGYVERALEITVLTEEPVIAELVAVIGGQEDQSLVVAAVGLERRDEPAERIVEV